MKKLIIFSLFGIAALSSCKKNLIPSPKEEPQVMATQTKDLQVSADFKWNTNVTLDVSITPQVAGVMLILDEKATAVYKAVVTPGQKHIANITVPATLNKLFIYFNGQKEEITNIRVSQFASSLK